MKASELQNSRRYRLTRDVTNPSLDRRERYDVARLPWTAGDVFRASVRGDSRRELKALFIGGTPRQAHHQVNEHHDGFEALVSALELLPESPSDVCARYFMEDMQHAVLRRLFEIGKITLDDIDAACVAESAEDEAS
ncbi:MAG: hypothetical protein WAV09_03200 [Minisyncoccia bacterium]